MAESLILGSISIAPLSSIAKETETVHCDVVVIGAGGAGLSAALSATEAGAKVLVLEKLPVIGGNTALAAGYILSTLGMTESDTREHEKNVISDILREGGSGADPKQVRHIVENSASSLSWLLKHGADLKIADLTDLYDGLQYRPSDNSLVGLEIVETLLNGLDRTNTVINTLCNVKSILTSSDGSVSGISVGRSDGSVWVARAPSVILATGGFSSNADMLAKHAPKLKLLPSTNSPGSTGDGIQMAVSIGAETVQMDAAVVHPTTLAFSGIVIPKRARRNGAVLLNNQGRRFSNEMDNHLSAEIFRKTNGRAWLVMDRKILDMMPSLNDLVEAGYIVQANSPKELALQIHVKPHILEKELERYAFFVKHGSDHDFGRPHLVNDLSHMPLYAVKVSPGVHCTLGGLHVDELNRVQGVQGPIPGLFAAGDVTGGIFGKSRPEGGGLMQAIVGGKIAGMEAADFAVKHRR